MAAVTICSDFGVPRKRKSITVSTFSLLYLPWTDGTEVMTNLDSILKSRDIILPTKVHIVKAIVFPVVMYGYESWTIKKAERFSKEWMLLNYGVGEDSWASLGPQGNQTSPA